MHGLAHRHQDARVDLDSGRRRYGTHRVDPVPQAGWHHLPDSREGPRRGLRNVGAGRGGDRKSERNRHGLVVVEQERR